MNSSTTLARGVLVNTLAFLTSNLRGIFTFLVARVLGSAALGTFSIAWAIVDLASKFATLGLDYSVVASVAQAEAMGDRETSRRIRSNAVGLALTAGVVVASIGSAIAMVGLPRMGVAPELAVALSWMFLAVPGIALYRVCNGLSRGMKAMHHDVYSRGLTESLGTTAVFFVALALGLGERAPALAAIVGTGAAGLVAFWLARGLYAPSHAPRQAPPDAPASKLALARMSLPIATYDLLNIGVMRLDVIVLGLFVGRAPNVSLETVGIYAACVEIGGGLRKLSQAFTPILTPVLAEHLARQDQRQAESSYALVARWMLAVLLPLVFVLGLAGAAVLALFGPTFQQGATWLAIVSAACALNAFVGLGETILMIQRPAWNVWNTAAACVVAIGANFMLIPRFGPLGAALGMLVPYVVQGLLRGFELTRLLGWTWPSHAFRRPWIAALVALPAALVVRATIPSLVGSVASAAVYVMTYVAAWRYMGLDSDDQDLFASWRARGTRNA